MGLADGKFDGGFKCLDQQGRSNRPPKQFRSNRREWQLKNDIDNNDRGPRRNGRSYGENGGKLYRSSYLGGNVGYDNAAAEKKPAKLDETTIELGEFCDVFVTSDYRQSNAMVRDDLPDLIRAMRFYYSKNASDEKVAILNKFIKICCTSKFVNSLATVLDSRVWLDDGTWDEIWRDMVFSISIALETNYERMHTDVVKKYVRDILPRIWQPEISDIARRTGVTRDLALDLLIAIPMMNSKNWTNTSISVFYDRFLDKMLIHAEDNMDILNWEIQGILFDMFFDKRNSTNIKVIGRYLVTERMEQSGDTIKDAVYNEFIKMLYAKLDGFDIKEISWCLDFVANEFKRLDDEGKKPVSPIFSFTECKKYSNVMKGLADVIDRNNNAGRYLAD